MKKKFLLGLVVAMLCIFAFGTIVVSAADTELQSLHSHPICNSRCDCDKGHVAVTWEPLTSDITNLSAGYYYVESDITYPNYTSLTITGDVYICLNGNKITQNTSTSCIMVRESGNLTICDCIGSGVISNSYSNGGSPGCVYLNGKGSMTLYGGTIKGNAFAAIYCSTAGNLNVYGGTVTGYFGGIDVSKVNDIVISSGTITGTESGGVEFESATFQNVIVSGGIFEGPQYGMRFGSYTCTGKVSISGGTFNGNGPVPNSTTYSGHYYGLTFMNVGDIGCTLNISGGEFKGTRGGFYSENKKMNATISGGTFYHNAEEAVHIANGRLTINGGKIYHIDCDDSATVSISNGEILSINVGGGFKSSSKIYVYGGTIGRIGYQTVTWAINCPLGNPNYTIYVYVYGGTIVGTEYAIRGNSNIKITVSGGNLTGGKKDISLPITAPYYYAAYLSLYGYNGKTLNVTTSSSVEEGAYIASDVASDGLIGVDDAKIYSVYDSTNKAVKIMRKHFFGDWVDEVPATCVVNGTKGYKVCSDCGKKFDESGTEITNLTIKASHKFGDWVNEIPATCTVDGTKAHKTCSVCGKHFEQNGTEIADITIPASHKLGDWVDEIPPTRTSDGVKGHRICEACGKYFDSNNEELVDLVIKAYLSLLNKVEIYGDSSAESGTANISQILSFATDTDVSALYCFIKYPDCLALKSVTAKDFAYAELEEKSTEDGITTAVILAQYSETELIPKSVIHSPFELTFDVSKSATPGVVQIEVTEESCLIGNDTYFFEERIAGNLEITPKLAESIEISGADVISCETLYTATVTPDYASNKEVEWSVDDEGIAFVDEFGMVTPVTGGTFTLTATAKDGSGVFATKTIEIIRLAESIEIVGEEEISEPSQYTVVILPEYTTNQGVQWAVSDETIAIVSENGLVTPLRNGKIVLTATALDASGIETTKSIVITVSVRANSITSNVGEWDREFDSDITEYTIYVTEDTSALYLTSGFTDATAKVNGSIAANGIRKKVELQGAETEVNIVLTPISGNSLHANTYTIKIIRGPCTKTAVFEDGAAFTVTPIHVEIGKTVILALYDGSKLVEMQPKTYEGEDLFFTTQKSYTGAKVMVWESLDSLTSVCSAELIQ